MGRVGSKVAFGFAYDVSDDKTHGRPHNMLRTIKNLLAHKAKKQVRAGLPSDELDLEDVPRYPPFMKGLPSSPPDKVLATQTELLGRIRLLLGMGDAQYEQIVAPVITRYAQFVHLLPASEAHHHRGAGGLLRHGLEVGFWAAQFSLGQVFPYDGPPRNKRAHELRWLFAAFVAGLTHDLGKPLSDMEITTAQGESVWPPYIESLEGWARRVQAERYFVRWRGARVHKRHESFTLMMFEKIVGKEAMNFLSEYDARLLPALFNAIGGTTASDALAKLVMRADQESVKRDLQQSRINVDEFSYGVPVEKYVFDAMRTLVKSGAWTVNEAGAAVWVLQEGVFIAWQTAMGGLRTALDKAGVPGIPRDSDTLADILIERGYALGKETITEDGEVLNYRYWPITAPVATGEMTGEVKILTLRLDAPELIFTGEVPAAKSGAMITDGAQPKPGVQKAQSPAGLADAGNAGQAAAGAAPSLAQAQQAITQAPVKDANGILAPEQGVATGSQQDQCAAAGQAEGTDQQDEGIPPDFPDMVKALMATEPEAPPLKMAPEPEPDDDASATDPSAQDAGPAFGPDDMPQSLGAEAFIPKGSPATAPEKGSVKPKGRSSNKDKTRATNADILGAGSGGTAAYVFDPFGTGGQKKQQEAKERGDTLPGIPGAGRKGDVSSEPVPSAQTSKKPARKREVQKVEQKPLNFTDALGSFPDEARTPVLGMLQAILSGNGRLGETIDRREGVYCVRAKAFESDEAFAKWCAAAADCKMLSDSFDMDTLWEPDAVALCESLQVPIEQAIRQIEQSLDPFAMPAAMPDIPETADQAPDGKKAGHGRGRGKRKAATTAHTSDRGGDRGDAPEHMPQDRVPLDEIAGSSSEPIGESIAQSVQKVMELSQPRPKITARDAALTLTEMLSTGQGGWLVDLKVMDKQRSVELSGTFDRALAEAQCAFSKTQLRMAVMSSPNLLIKEGRVFVVAR